MPELLNEIKGRQQSQTPRAHAFSSLSKTLSVLLKEESDEE